MGDGYGGEGMKKAVRAMPLTAFSKHFRKTQKRPKTAEGIIMEEFIFIFMCWRLLSSLFKVF